MVDLTGYKLTFDDEFNARSISQDGVGTRWADIRTQWRFDANSDIGFGHSSFVDPGSGYDPFVVAGGVLSITAVPDRTAFGYPGSWESGLITTQGHFSQTYGYFEMRADLADAKGGWDAFWLLPNQPAANPLALTGWQELDVVEHYGAYNQGSYRWIHTTDPVPNQNPNADLQVFSNNPTQVTGYHTYGMDWQADRISFYFDGQFMGSRPTPSDMHGPMYLLANLASQSDADEAGLPMTMYIDYIRAYSNAPGAVAIPQDAMSAPDGQDPGLYGATVGLPVLETSQFASNSNWLVNSNFYFGAHPGAANSGLTAAAHYNSIGWHQNYDPNAFFSTVGYLAVNADVRAAGVNPLEKFDQNGWKDGHDPSANFDTSLYLEHNPDVRAADIDPLTHYLQYGRAEGRQAYTAVGQAGSFTNGSFDPEYYLLSNPDVAQAAIAAGGNSFAFARTHFETYGWREGRNPDAFFDTKGYLQAYADVRAAGMNPLTHYDQYGWREGRDPSGAFDTDQYLSHYTDVAAAHIDPLQHYLSYGIHEARLPFSDWLII